jgi:hypothetical protein
MIYAGRDINLDSKMPQYRIDAITDSMQYLGQAIGRQCHHSDCVLPTKPTSHWLKCPQWCGCDRGKENNIPLDLRTATIWVSRTKILDISHDFYDIRMGGLVTYGNALDIITRARTNFDRCYMPFTYHTSKHQKELRIRRRVISILGNVRALIKRGTLIYHTDVMRRLSQKVPGSRTNYTPRQYFDCSIDMLNKDIKNMYRWKTMRTTRK